MSKETNWKSWYNKYYKKNETKAFLVWFLSESRYDHKEKKDDYWIKRGFALNVWRACQEAYKKGGD